MKQILRTLTIATLAVCCVHTASPAKQSVRASKKDPLDEREVTVKIFGSNMFGQN